MRLTTVVFSLSYYWLLLLNIQIQYYFPYMPVNYSLIAFNILFAIVMNTQVDTGAIDASRRIYCTISVEGGKGSQAQTWK